MKRHNTNPNSLKNLKYMKNDIITTKESVMDHQNQKGNNQNSENLSKNEFIVIDNQIVEEKTRLSSDYKQNNNILEEENKDMNNNMRKAEMSKGKEASFGDFESTINNRDSQYMDNNQNKRKNSEKETLVNKKTKNQEENDKNFQIKESYNKIIDLCHIYNENRFKNMKKEYLELEKMKIKEIIIEERIKI
jgi:hypothetical protein